MIGSPGSPPPLAALGTPRPARPQDFGMILAALFFYLFAGVCVASAFMVIAAKNPVHSVLFLILTFVSASGLFVLLGAEFLAMILIVVYVGAGVVLLVAMVGAIVLTLRHKERVKRQDMGAQVRRTKAEAMEVVKVRPGQGLT